MMARLVAYVSFPAREKYRIRYSHQPRVDWK